MLFIGIDLGTSSVKIVLCDKYGDIKGSLSKEYPCFYKKTGWSEQNPSDWYDKTIEGINELLETLNVSKDDVVGISFAGQMHGLVVLDENDEVIRPAILWNDNRSDVECDFLNNKIGKEYISKNTGNIAFPGFTAPKILWMKNNEVENFNKIKKIMLPKDYLAYKLSGNFCTDVSDASGTLLFDVKNRKWSDEMIDLCDLTIDKLPRVYESYEKVGNLLPNEANKLGLSENVSIIAGAGDNEAAAISNKTVKEGQCNISLGTSGTIYMPTDYFFMDSRNGLHSFCDASNKYHLMGCMLSAASSNKWWINDILGSDDFKKEESDIKELGTNDVYFLPYMMGERSPHNDPYARGAFIGLSLNTKKSQMTQAIMEGVSFALRDSYEIARDMGININQVTICGGGATSDLWKEIIANVLNKEIYILEKEEGPGYGACILAMVGCNVYQGIDEACEKLNNIKQTIKPTLDISKKYEYKYSIFKSMYPSLKEIFKNMNEGDKS